MLLKIAIGPSAKISICFLFLVTVSKFSPYLHTVTLPLPSPSSLLPPWPQTLSKRRINKLELTLIHWRTRLRSKPQRDATAQRPVTLRKRRQQIKTEDNWPLFYYQFNEDHSLSTLILNYKVSTMFLTTHLHLLQKPD